MKSKSIKVYMDGVDWQHEIGQAAGGNVVYASLKDLKVHNTCWEECGVVEVTVKFNKWVVDQNFDLISKNKKNIKKTLIKKTKEKIDNLQKYLEMLEKEQL